jgi:peptide-methionine (R)-S-oxide reductase
VSEKVIRSEEEWRRQLTPEQYAVTRQHATEPPFAGLYCNEHDVGTYRCVCCGEPLFSSEAKFESGSAGPVFGNRLLKRTSALRRIRVMA